MRALATALLGVAVATAPALAQRAPRYDPDAEVTVTGVVVDTHEAKRRNDHPGLHFVLEIALPPAAEPEAAEVAAPEAPTGEATAEGPQAPVAPEPAAGLEPGASAVPAPPPPGPEDPAVPAAPEPAGPAEPEAPAPPSPPAVPVETVEVHACPMDLLGYLDFTVEKGDELTITGSRPGDGSIIVAREIVKGEVKLQVRDPKGVPIWTELQ